MTHQQFVHIFPIPCQPRSEMIHPEFVSSNIDNVPVCYIPMWQPLIPPVHPPRILPGKFEAKFEVIDHTTNEQIAKLIEDLGHREGWEETGEYSSKLKLGDMSAIDLKYLKREHLRDINIINEEHQSKILEAFRSRQELINLATQQLWNSSSSLLWKSLNAKFLNLGYDSASSFNKSTMEQSDQTLAGSLRNRINIHSYKCSEKLKLLLPYVLQDFWAPSMAIHSRFPKLLFFWRVDPMENEFQYTFVFQNFKVALDVLSQKNEIGYDGLKMLRESNASPKNRKWYKVVTCQPMTKGRRTDKKVGEVEVDEIVFVDQHKGRKMRVCAAIKNGRIVTKNGWVFLHDEENVSFLVRL